MFFIIFFFFFPLETNLVHSIAPDPSHFINSINASSLSSPDVYILNGSSIDTDDLLNKSSDVLARQSSSELSADPLVVLNPSVDLKIHVHRIQQIFLTSNSSDEFELIKLRADLIDDAEWDNTEIDFNGLANRGRLAQDLSNRSCIAIITKKPNPVLSDTCPNAFIRYWNNSDHNIIPSVVCGGYWVPRGGRLEDLTSDTILPFSTFSDSIAFKLPTQLIREVAKISVSVDPLLLGPKIKIDDKVSSFSNEQLPSEALLHTNFVGSEDSLVQHGDLRICFYPSSTPDPTIVPRDVGSLTFIPLPKLAPILHRGLRSGVRIFLNPGWEVQVPVTGFNFTEDANLLSLKLGDCTGFADSTSFRMGHPVSINHLVQPNLKTGMVWSNPEVFDEALFSFKADFKVEESE